MKKETTIKDLDTSINPDIIRRRINKSLDTNLTFNFESFKELSNIIFDKEAFLYLNPTENAKMNNIISLNDPLLTILSSGDFFIRCNLSRSK